MERKQDSGTAPGARDAAAGVTGALLAGGLSARMGGRDKAMLTIGARTMLAHVIARLAPQVGRIVVNANGDAERFAGTCLPVVADTIEGHPGPLAGLHACLTWAQAETPDARFVATVPVDTPFLPADLVARLMAALGAAGARAAIASSEGRQHPVVGVWDVTLRNEAAAALQRDERAMHRFAQAQGAAVVDFPLIEVADTLIDPFFNVNTPADLGRAAALLAPTNPPS
jgi:molybdenum cofactor guanylyltransferase